MSISSGIEFRRFDKISRLANEQMTISEKIDGTNACVIFLPSDNDWGFEHAAQSRNKLITPESDNAGFAKWVWQNVDELYADLGFGYHYGEYWGSGIQRGYGKERGEKFFSLFNALRWQDAEFKTERLASVPLIYHGGFEEAATWAAVNDLYKNGSKAAPGYDKPEGVVVYLHEAKCSYKVTDAVAGNKPRMPNE